MLERIAILKAEALFISYRKLAARENRALERRCHVARAIKRHMSLAQSQNQNVESV